MRGKTFKAALVALALGVAPAHAQLSVDRLWVDFEPGASRRADVVVRNESPDRYYITITAAEIIQPGTKEEKRVETTDPEVLGLLVTPNRLVIDPGGMRSVRVVSLDDKLTKDRVYRVKITPQVGDIQTNVAADSKGIAIKILAAYDILVTARPDNARPEIVMTQERDELVIRNIGNSNSLLYEGQACEDKPANVQEACTKLGARRLYAGNEWRIAVPQDQRKIQFKQRLKASSDPVDLNF